jgi:hypothetical protein
MGTQAPPKPAGHASAPTATTVANANLAKARKARKTIDPNETPEQSFKRLCESRVTKLLKQIRQVKHLARLKPSEAYRAKVFGTISEALKVAHDSWKGNGAVESEGFQL